MTADFDYDSESVPEPQIPSAEASPWTIPYDDRPWIEDALCTQADPEMFFPEKGGSTRPAKSVCRRCAVRAECLDYALSNQERFGIWGGLSERDRRNLSPVHERRTA